MNELDEAASRAHEILRFLREEYEERARPYLRILADIEAMRPRVYYVDGKTMVPFLRSVERASYARIQEADWRRQGAQAQQG